MPVGAERADVVLLGGTPSNTMAMVIELKQWTRITGNATTHDVYVPALRDQRHVGKTARCETAAALGRA